MRELKFRALLRREHCFREVYGIDFLNLKVLVPISGSYEWHKWRVLSQYTGLKDKKDVEIYDGDVVNVDRRDSFTSFNEAIISYSDDYGAFLLQYTKDATPGGILSQESISSKDGKTIFDYCTGWRLEVIGNIFER